MRKYLIYKTINKINKKFYIGAHETDNENDSYLGSGIVLNKAIEKYGKEAFKKEILSVCSSREEMYEQEQKIIAEHINNPSCYNIKTGGIGGWDYVNKMGINLGKNNAMKNPKTVRKCVSAVKKTKSKNPYKYKQIAITNLKKATEKNTGSTRPSSFKKIISRKSKNHWRKNKSKMRDALSSWFKITDPSGKEHQTNRLEEFCISRNLVYTTLWKTSKTGITPNRGRSKGWLCQQITQK